ncbi:type VI secretion system Vgr family protein [Fulvimonas sp. R45]|uniref:type VI secretion system Vgr family protein n=1 Tax=Fulvimonas sp. R45 TaxID=3045937 RepID=UPI00265ED36D|nr:type VI secretion system Vgr family protein [Fulvimonas sp. R45]MDO1530433.1 type VI secretion system Vgr family protein [Fulvimonas sp. R45]
MEAMDVSAWLNLLSQRTRFITLDTAAADGLIVERFQGREGVNEDFRFELDCVSASAFIDLQPLPGRPVRLGVATADGGRRDWHGYVTHAAALGADGGLARYRLVVESALAFLRLRRNTLIVQDKTALEVIGQVFGDHPELRWRNDSTATLRTRPVCTQYRETDADFVRRLLGEEGLSFRFEHDQGGAGDGPGHTLVVFDPAASQSLPAGEPAAIRFHRVDATEAEDAITLFSERRQVVPDQVATTSWAADQVQGVSGSAQAETGGSAPELPALDVFEADRAHRFDTAGQADRQAAARLDALRLLARSFPGQGAVRTLEAGKTYALAGHPDLTGQAFVPLWVEHRATNNLGTDLPHLLGHAADDALGKGSYRNTFLAIPAGTRIAPDHRDKPLAPGCGSALVVGVPGAALTGTRDHQVRVQFWWQRGVAPLAGGLTDTASRSNPEGHAPGDDHAGTWVRVAEANAGAHHGHSFVPRLGDEVLVEYAHGDIDQPVVVGTLYNGQAAPPFAAGEGSSANHPGTLSGLQTQTLAGQPGARWVLDDASSQLRHSLAHSVADSQLNLGYLVDQQGNTRGAYRGEGFELMTAGWALVRAGEGVLVSGTARPQGQSTAMDAAEAVGQLKAAATTAQRLDSAAMQAKATALQANPAHADLQQAIDPQQDGHYAGTVNGQAATKPRGDQRSGGDPVERFAQPVALLETPESLALTTPASAALFAGGHQHLTSQRDTHLAAGATLALAAGQNAGLYAADGGMKLVANHGPVSLEAHTDALEILADQSVTVTSTTDRINVLAKNTIVLQAGQSTITLDGPNITIACPGNFTVKSGTHDWLGGENQAAQLLKLPEGTVTFHGNYPRSR